MSHVYCPECGFQNPESANYCSRCGALLVRGRARVETTHDASRPRRCGARTRDARGARHRGAGARRPLRRRPGGGELPARRASARRIGRSPDCDIFLDDVTVSRKPRRARRSATARSSIEDQGSLNGTFVNRRRIEQAALEDGDELQIGKYRLTFLETMTRPPSADSRSARGCCTIGAVCRRLQAEFPDISISKIRYLEDQGLLAPRRTQGGYRLFSEDDVERLRDDPAAAARRVPAAARDPRGARLAAARARSAAPARRSALGRPGRRARPRRALRARRRSRPSSRASSRSSGCSQPRASGGEKLYPASDVDIAAACAQLARFGVDAAPPAHVPHGGRPRGRPARAARRAGAALAQPRAPRARRSSDLQALAELAQELSQLLFWRDLRRRRAQLTVTVDLQAKIRDVPDFPKPGIVFKDIMPLLADPAALRETVDQLADVGRAAQARPRPRRRGARLHPRRRRSRTGSAAASSPRASPASCRGRRSARRTRSSTASTRSRCTPTRSPTGSACSSTTTCSRPAAPRRRSCELVEQLGGEVVGAAVHHRARRS